MTTVSPMTSVGTGYHSDLMVERRSDALVDRNLDVIVSGSISAVESIRFIRSLRRLGANVTPWLTRGGAQFVTPMALAWAAGRDVRLEFSGDASHIALGDACLIAPASANLLGKCAHGLTDTPATALVASYLGSGKPVLMLPNMHDSLIQGPAFSKNIKTLIEMGVERLASRREEGKQKFPDPATLADEAAHLLNRSSESGASALITLGTTRGYLDDVRYLSNYSTGTLGSLIAEELFRLGIRTQIVAGPCPRQPRVYSSLAAVYTNEEMAEKATAALTGGASAAVLAASVLDFKPEHRQSGKISSSSTEHLTVKLVRTSKIIAGIHPSSGIKVGFKLESGLTEQRAKELAHEYIAKYGLSLMVINDLALVDADRHTALLATPSGNKQEIALIEVSGKREVAHAIAHHVASGIKAAGD